MFQGLLTKIAAASGMDTNSISNGLNNVNPGQGTDLQGGLNSVINWVLMIVGMVTVIVIIYGGVRYTTSAGDPGKVTAAKNTIMYGVIGLIICVLAFAIVQFVLNAFK